MNWLTRIFQPAKYEAQVIKQYEERSLGSVFAPAEFYTHNPSSGVMVGEQTALGVSPLYRALDVISGKAASLDRCVIKHNSDGTKKTIANHPVAKALNIAPCDLYSANSFISFMFWNAVLHGNGIAWIKSRYPLRIYGLQPQHTILRYMNDQWLYQATIYETKDGDIVTAAVNTSQLYVSGARAYTVYIPMSEVFHLKAGVGDMLVGYSLIDILRDALGEQIALQKYSSAFFGNGCKLGTIVELPPGFNVNDPENVRRYRQQWEEKHKGPYNANKIAYVSNGTKAYNLGLNNEQIEWSKARESLSPMVVSQLTGVPCHLLGVTAGSSQYKNEAEKTQSFLQFTMANWLDRFEAEARLKLLSENEKDSGDVTIEFNRKQLIEHDIETVNTINKDKLLNGMATINELLAAENKEGIGPDGDTRFMPSTVKPLDQLLEPPEPPAPLAPPPGASPAAADKAPADKGKAAAVKRTMNRLRRSVEARAHRPDFPAWLQGEFADYHRKVLLETLEPFNPDADVIIDDVLMTMAQELSACLKEQIKDVWDKYAKRFNDEI